MGLISLLRLYFMLPTLKSPYSAKRDNLCGLAPNSKVFIILAFIENKNLSAFKVVLSLLLTHPLTQAT